MGWQADIARLPDDRARVEYLCEELRRRDAEGCALFSAVQGAFGLSPAEARIVTRLVRSLGIAVPYDLLIDAMEPGEETGNPHGSLHVLLCSARRKMRGSPMQIETVHGYGLRLNGPDTLFGPHLSASGSNAPTAPGAGSKQEKQNVCR
ncbi:helix-turn-helix domain-containing protein [Meridianimarinicoccus sp. RP-17]